MGVLAQTVWIMMYNGLGTQLLSANQSTTNLLPVKINFIQSLTSFPVDFWTQSSPTAVHKLTSTAKFLWAAQKNRLNNLNLHWTYLNLGWTWEFVEIRRARTWTINNKLAVILKLYRQKKLSKNIDTLKRSASSDGCRSRDSTIHLLKTSPHPLSPLRQRLSASMRSFAVLQHQKR